MQHRRLPRCSLVVWVEQGPFWTRVQSQPASLKLATFFSSFRSTKHDVALLDHHPLMKERLEGVEGDAPLLDYVYV